MGFKDERNKYNAKFGKDTERSLNQRDKAAKTDYNTEFGRENQFKKAPLRKDKDGYYYRDDNNRDVKEGFDKNQVEFSRDNFEQNENEKQNEQQNIECGEDNCPHCH
ncbi:MAG: hypothetical protein M0R05_03545 [Bacilli bacterium]|nr:hypothetical protein [Bacilli bacterium]MDD4077769.1 hypothetical protein [Bacilli bacterium]MDD4388207.1 hypothetical protein [Bacilli bacterium]